MCVSWFEYGYTVAIWWRLARSIVELGDKGHAALNPVGLCMAAQNWKPDHADEVSGVTCGRQCTEALQSLVDWALVAVRLDNVCAWLHPDEGHFGEKLLGVRFFECSLLFVPSAAFKEHTVDVSTVRSFSFLIEFRFVHHLVIPLNLIDSDSVLSSIVLLQSSQETLCEEET